MAELNAPPTLDEPIPRAETLRAELPHDGLFRVLTLDGGGAKGFYTLGVLKEIEGLLGCPLYKRFNLIFGTSTGSIIGALLALGCEADQIHDLYKNYVPPIMQIKEAAAKSAALRRLGDAVFKDRKFDAVKTAIGIVATRWVIERPMIFKGSVAQAHGRVGTFVPGFGCAISDAVQASCSAYPFFERKVVVTAKGDHIELVDGGYVPTTRLFMRLPMRLYLCKSRAGTCASSALVLALTRNRSLASLARCGLPATFKACSCSRRL
jgi:uncharacterized protein